MAQRIFKPTEIRDAAEVVAWAVSEAAPLEVRGNGSKSAIGNAVNAAQILDLSGFKGIDLYEPEELVLRAGVGTPLADIQKILRKHKQELAFEPSDYSGLFGTPKKSQTIGGVLATNLSGPRRIRAGAARDHFLGVKAVSGRGEIFKSGGRVVKNVTGYDMCKVLAGSWGTLAAMTEVTLKVLPAPEYQASVVLYGLDEATAVSAMAQAMMSDCEITGAAHLPAQVTALSTVKGLRGAGQAATLLRMEGIEPSVAYRTDRLIAVLKDFGNCDVMKPRNSEAVWGEIRDVRFFEKPGMRCIWKISVAPGDGAAIAHAAKQAGAVLVYLDWAGGLIWASFSAKGDGGASALRSCLDSRTGHATLIRAPNTIRAAQAVFHPLDPGLRALHERIKAGFDPAGVLNPGRMFAGI